MKLVLQELTIEAPPSVVYEFLVDPERFVEWMADSVTLEPTPGDQIRWTLANGDTVAGAYVELVPGRRVVFTYGWEPGSRHTSRLHYRRDRPPPARSRGHASAARAPRTRGPRRRCTPRRLDPLSRPTPHPAELRR